MTNTTQTLRDMVLQLLTVCLTRSMLDWDDEDGLFQEARALLGLVDCPRCQGRGEYPYGLEETLGTCEKCDGLGLIMPAIAEAAKEKA
mgnify:CR=1 FL=1